LFQALVTDDKHVGSSTAMGFTTEKIPSFTLSNSMRFENDAKAVERNPT